MFVDNGCLEQIKHRWHISHFIVKFFFIICISNLHNSEIMFLNKSLIFFIYLYVIFLENMGCYNDLSSILCIFLGIYIFDYMNASSAQIKDTQRTPKITRIIFRKLLIMFSSSRVLHVKMILFANVAWF